MNDELDLYTVKESDFDFLKDKYWLIRSCFAERGLVLPDEPPLTDEEDEFFENYNQTMCRQTNGKNGLSNGTCNGKSDVLERLHELEALERLERNERELKKPPLTLNVPGTVTRTRPTFTRTMLNKLGDINTRTFTRPKRSPVHPTKTFASHFEHELSDDLLNISEADIEADMNRIMGSSLFSSDAFTGGSSLTNNQSFIVTKVNGDHKNNNLLSTTIDMDTENDALNATFTNGNGHSPGLVNNYDDVQELARQQEEALKKKSNLLRNNTIVKTRRVPPSDLTATVIKVKPSENFQNGLSNDDKLDLNSTFSKNDLPPFLHSPGAVLELDSPDKTERLTSRRSFVISKTSTITKKPVEELSKEHSDSTSSLNLLDNTKMEVSFNLDAHPSPQPRGRLSRAFSAGTVGTQTITKGFKNSTVLKRTKTFKVREYQSISEENLNINSNKELKVYNGAEKSSCLSAINKAESGELFKQPSIALQKKYSKSNNNLQESFTPLKENSLLNTSIKKSATKIPSFTSRLKAPESSNFRSQLPSFNKSMNNSFKLSAKIETHN